MFFFQFFLYVRPYMILLVTQRRTNQDLAPMDGQWLVDVKTTHEGAKQLFHKMCENGGYVGTNRVHIALQPVYI